jgi:hypothetical protein
MQQCLKIAPRERLPCMLPPHVQLSGVAFDACMQTSTVEIQ